ncbi:glycoside hydrolase family 5 protein [Pseudohyphozyma bogoriensis]|nr:glycoside hydrolase family 5 protein [Pseudohyphozyma bogoriensis]
MLASINTTLSGLALVLLASSTLAKVHEGVPLHPREVARAKAMEKRLANWGAASADATATTQPGATATVAGASATITAAATGTAFAEPSGVVAAGASCASSYTGGTMITGTGTLPKPTSFVKRQNSISQNLVLDGSAFKIVGPNIYWLCQDENVAPVGYYTSKTRVREALAIAVAMGATTIRALSCGISVGSEYSLLQSLNNYAAAGAEQWDIHDYVVYAAGQYGLRILMTLTDNYQYYTGGRYDFLTFRGLSTANFGSLFYTNKAPIVDYRVYIKTLMNHVNPYNGLAWNEDPTIIGWETGNELGGYIGAQGQAPCAIKHRENGIDSLIHRFQAWQQAISFAIKQNSPHQLVFCGDDGFYNYTTKAVSTGLNLRTFDVMSDHGYPRNVALLESEDAIIQALVRPKPFLIGEYDWTNSFGGDSLVDYLAYIEGEGNHYVGDMIWNVMGHDDTCCNYVQHNDGYSMYYPFGNNNDALSANILAVVQHWYRVTGRTVPSQLLSVQCPQPAF